MRIGLFISVFVILICSCRAVKESRTAGKQSEEPVVADMIRRGAETRRRMESEGCKWSCTFQIPEGARVQLECATTPSCKSISVTFGDKGNTTEDVRIIERDGLWYVAEYGKPIGKFRPYEAVFSYGVVYALLQTGKPRVVSEELMRRARYVSTSNGVALYRAPADSRPDAVVEKSLKTLEESFAALPEGRNRQAIEERIRETRKEFEEGRPIEIDPEAGVVRKFTIPDWFEVIFRGPQWTKVSESTFDVSDVDWKDYNSDPAEGVDPEDLLLISHCRGWSHGMSDRNADCGLLNVKTREYRRVPFVGATAWPGCFLKGRTSVVVLGAESIDGGPLGLYEIDLRTGSNRRLGGGQLRDRLCFSPCLSPDGRTLAYVNADFAAGITLDTQVTLLDLKTDAIRTIGDPLYASHLSWLPSGEGLILANREASTIVRSSQPTICRMDLEGNLTKIRKGDSPLLLEDGKTILFDRNDNEWWTCDLRGKHVKPYAEGMPEAGNPTACPDGKRIAWMVFADRPIPCIGKLKSANLKSITRAPGLWTYPQWR